jgi:hypothetical protein
MYNLLTKTSLLLFFIFTYISTPTTILSYPILPFFQSTTIQPTIHCILLSIFSQFIYNIHPALAGLCPAGTASPTGSAPGCVNCGGNTWSEAGYTACQPCPPGTYIRVGAPTAAPTPNHDQESDQCTNCPVGTYNPLSGQPNSGACLACNLAGYYCPYRSYSQTGQQTPRVPTTSLTAPTAATTTLDKPCGVGYCGVANRPNSFTSSNCAGRCQEGYDCSTPGSVCPGLPCGTDSYCKFASTSPTAITVKLPIPAGQEGRIAQTCTPTANPLQSPTGSLCSPVATPDPFTTDTFQDVKNCRPGYYCPKQVGGAPGGKPWINATKCPAGTFQTGPAPSPTPLYTIATAADCSTTRCVGACAPSPTNAANRVTGLCTAGFFCPEGSVRDKQEYCAPIPTTTPELYYCPEGTTTRQPTPALGYMAVPARYSVGYAPSPNPLLQNFSSPTSWPLRMGGIAPCPTSSNIVCIDGVKYDVWSNPTKCLNYPNTAGFVNGQSHTILMEGTFPQPVVVPSPTPQQIPAKNISTGYSLLRSEYSGFVWYASRIDNVRFSPVPTAVPTPARNRIDCQPNDPTRNGGDLFVLQNGGDLKVSRVFVNSRSNALNYEICDKASLITGVSPTASLLYHLDVRIIGYGIDPYTSQFRVFNFTFRDDYPELRALNYDSLDITVPPTAPTATPSALYQGSSAFWPRSCVHQINVLAGHEPPYFPYDSVGNTKVKHLIIKEKSLEGTVATVCTNANTVWGCPYCDPAINGTCDTVDGAQAQDPDLPKISATHAIVENDATTDREPTIGVAPNPLWALEIDSCSGELDVLRSDVIVWGTAKTYNLNGVPGRAIHYKVAATDTQTGAASENVLHVYVWIINVNDRPVLLTQTPNFNIAENAPPFTIVYSNPSTPPVYDEDGDIPTITVVTDTCMPNRCFETIGNSSLISLTEFGKTYLNYEVASRRQVQVTLQADDHNVNGIATAVYTFDVTDTNDPPVFTNTKTFYIGENSAINSPVCLDIAFDFASCINAGFITTTDEDRDPDFGTAPNDFAQYYLLTQTSLFSIDSNTGAITSNVIFDYETTPSLGLQRGYTLQIVAMSWNHPSSIVKNSTSTVDVVIKDINEAPTWTTSGGLATNPVTTTIVLESQSIGSQAYDKIHANDPDHRNNVGTLQSLFYSVSPLVDQTFPGDPTNSYTSFAVTDSPSDYSAIISLAKKIDYETAATCVGSSTGKCATFQSTVTDGLLSTVGTITVEIVNTNDPPSFNGVSTFFTNITENTDCSGTSIVLPGIFYAMDPDVNDIDLTYEIVPGGSGDGKFEIVPYHDVTINSNKTIFTVRTKANNPSFLIDYETASPKYYVLNVRVKDLGPPSVVGSTCTQASDCGSFATCAAALNGAPGLRCFETCYPANTPRKSGILGYFCNYASPAARQFQSYEFADVTVRIDILDANDPPIVNSGSSTGLCTYNRSIVYAESTTKTQTALSGVRDQTSDQDPTDNAAGFVYSWDLSYSAPTPAFAGTLSSAGFVLNDTTGSITLPIGSLSGGGVGAVMAGRFIVTDTRKANTTCFVAVTLSDSNNPPVVTDQIVHLAENTGPGITVATLHATDSDNDPFTFSMTTNPFFSLNPVTGVVTTTALSVDYETQSVHVLKVFATDARGATSSVLGNSLTIIIDDVPEKPIFLESMPTTITTDETPGAPVPGTIQNGNIASHVTDQDAGSILTFTLVGCSGGTSCPFTISPGGIISYSRTLDYETLPNTWSFTIHVCDNTPITPLCNDAPLTVALRNVNEPPVFIPVPVSVVESLAQYSLAVDLNPMVTDPDAGDSLTYTIISGSFNKFAVSFIGLGLLSINETLDFENVRSYSLVIKVTDIAGASSTQTLSITVTNVNDLTVTFSSVTTLSSCGSGQVVQFTGTNFGVVASQVSVNPSTVIGTYTDSVTGKTYTSPSCSVITPNTVIQCTTAAGVGKQLIWTLTLSIPNLLVFNQVITLTDFPMSYPGPTIGAFTSPLLATKGNDIITVSGNCLGNVGDNTFPTSPYSTFKLCSDATQNTCYPVTSCSYLAANSLSCIAGPGLGINLIPVITVSRQSSDPLTTVFRASYLPPSISSLSENIIPTTGVPGLQTCCVTCFVEEKPCGNVCIPAAQTCATSQGCACAHPLAGGIANRKIIIRGNNFGGLGVIPDSVYARFFYTGAAQPGYRDFFLHGCIVTAPFTDVSCDSIDRGVGKNMSVSIVFASQTGTSLGVPISVISYVTPQFLTGTGAGVVRGSTVGGLTVKITGNNFGPICGSQSGLDFTSCPLLDISYSHGARRASDGMPIVYYPQCRVSADDTQIICLTAPGTGKDNKWRFFIGGQDAIPLSAPDSQQFFTSYGPPVVGAYSDVGAHDASTAGGQSIKLGGSQYGPIDGAEVAAVYGRDVVPEFNATLCHVIEANEMIQCITDEGAGLDLLWFLTVDGQASVSEQTNYAAPQITQLTGNLLHDTDGGQTVIFTGTNFGPTNPISYLDRVVYGPASFPDAYTATNCVYLTPHTQISCQTVPGVGLSMIWSVVVRGQTSSDISGVVTSYKQAFINSLTNQGTSQSTQGSNTILLEGTNLNLCGDSASFTFFVNVASGLTLVTPTHFEMKNSGGQFVPLVCPTASGNNRIQRVSFIMPPMTGTRRPQILWQVRASNMNGATFVSSNTIEYVYDAPVVTDIYATPNADLSNLRVTVFGRNFCASEACCQVKRDGAAVLLSDIESHSHNMIVFNSPSTGTVSVTCGDVTSNAKAFSSEDPFVLSTDPRFDAGKTFQTDGEEQVIVYGLFFGLITPRVFIGSNEAQVLLHETLSCDGILPPWTETTGTSLSLCQRTTIKIPIGQGTGHLLTVKNGNQTSHAERPYEIVNYSPPNIGQVTLPTPPEAPSSSDNTLRRRELATIDLCCFNTDGSDLATFVFTGSNFGISGQVFFGNVLGQIVSWTHTRVEAILRQGEGVGHSVYLIVGGQTAVTSYTVSFARPTITSVTTTSPVNTQGGAVMTIVGKNFGRAYNPSCILDTCTANPIDVKLTSSVTASCSVLTASHKQITCVVPEGAGKDISVTVTVKLQSRTLFRAFSYDPPMIYSVNPTNISTTGLDALGQPLIINVTGINFGVSDFCISLSYSSPLGGGVQVSHALGMRAKTQPQVFGCLQADGNPPPSMISAPSHTFAQFYAPSFFGKNIRVVVQASGQNSAQSGFLSYAPPRIINVTVAGSTFNVGAGKPISNIAFHPTIDQGYGDWSNVRYANQTCLTSATKYFRGLSWKTQLDIQSTGAFVRSIMVFSSTYCTSSNAMFSMTINGVMNDLGSHDVIKCARMFFEQSTVVTIKVISEEGIKYLTDDQCTCDKVLVTGVDFDYSSCLKALLAASTFPSDCKVPTRLFKSGYGIYMMADNSKLYMSSFPLAEFDLDVYGKSYHVLPDLPSAEIVNSLGVATPTGPTDGCHAWEREDAFRVRLAAAQRDGATTERQCLDPATITISGENFGYRTPVFQSSLRVFFYNNGSSQGFEAATVDLKGSHGFPCSSSYCKQTDTQIIVQIPPGSGRNLRIRVVVGYGDNAQANEVSNHPLYHYALPYILEALPGTVKRAKGFLNARGAALTIRGFNFGGSSSDVDIVLNGRVCEAATWISGAADVEGYPYLTCLAKEDVVGPKSAFVCVAGQSTITALFRSDVEIIKTGEKLGIWALGIGSTQATLYAQKVQSIVNSKCQVDETTGTRYYADMFGLCTACPGGAACLNISDIRFGAPAAEATYFRIGRPTWDEASQSVPQRTMDRCPRESWDNGNLTTNFPTVVVGDTCYDYVKCVPPEACLANNECADGYQYALKRCKGVRGVGPVWAMRNNASYVPQMSDLQEAIAANQSCSVYLDVYTGEWKGKDLECNPTGKICRSSQPEYCSTCHVTLVNRGIDVEPARFGRCECEVPERCAMCTIYEYYRLQGICQPCPGDPGLLIGMFFFIAICCIGAGFYLQKKNFNLAFISIGVDYFQVLSLFGSSNITWPALVYQIFQILSLFNFNIDITAPECLVPNLEYDFKWWLMELLPLGAGVVLVGVHFCYAGWKFYTRGHRADLTSHVPRLYAVFWTMFYYLYLNITKKALDIFNCNPADPDDGYFYTSFTSLSCEGSLCRCGEGIQLALQGPAIACLVLYSFGFPAFVLSRIIIYRNEILEDQYLRSNGIGESRLTNPHAYNIRKRYSKMYFHYKPELTHWILIVINRKFWIAFAALMFRGNVAFQLAVVLMVLFASYVLQVTHRPFMSSGERDKVRERLDVYVKMSLKNPTYLKYVEIQHNVMEARRRFLKRKRKHLMVRFEDGKAVRKTGWEEKEVGEVPGFERHAEHQTKHNASNYFFDYNTVEATLLSCAVLVCLIGLMFESGRFSANRKDLDGQRDFLTYSVFLVIFGSLVYYVVVFVGEMYQITGSNRCVRMFMRKKNEERVTQEDIDDAVVLDTNPQHANLAAAPEEIRAKEEAASLAIQSAQAQNAALREELRLAKETSNRLIAEREQKLRANAAARRVNKKNAMTTNVEDSDEEQEDEFGDEEADANDGEYMQLEPSTQAIQQRVGILGRGPLGKGLAGLLGGRKLDAGVALEEFRKRSQYPARADGDGSVSRDPEAGTASVATTTLGVNPIFKTESEDISIFQQQNDLSSEGLVDGGGAFNFLRRTMGGGGRKGGNANNNKAGATVDDE